MTLRQRQHQRQYVRNRRDAFRALGLTHEGKPRQRGFWHRYPHLDQLPPRERAVARVRLWRQRERYSKGLNQRGVPPGRPGRKPTPLRPLELAWLEFRSGKEFVLRRDRGNTTQTSTRPVSEDAGGNHPVLGTEDAESMTRVGSGGQHRTRSGGWAHSPQNEKCQA